MTRAARDGREARARSFDAPFQPGTLPRGGRGAGRRIGRPAVPGVRARGGRALGVGAVLAVICLAAATTAWGAVPTDPAAGAPGGGRTLRDGPAVVSIASAQATPAVAASSSPSPAVGSGVAASDAPASGDTSSPGQGPGFVGAPLLAVAGVLAIGLAAAAATLLYVRLAGEATGSGGGSRPDGRGGSAT